MRNPFTSKTFVNIWMTHFKNSEPAIVFKNFKGLKFYRSKRFPFYINVGRNLTKGIDYEFDDEPNDLNGKTVLIYDVPEYFELNDIKSKRYKQKKIFQYKGFLMNIADFESTEDYIKNRFSSKNRREFRSNERRLRTCFNITHEFYHGGISESDYDFIFKHFHRLLSIRFAGKSFNYHHLNPRKWSYYKALVYPMLIDKKASFLVIYDNGVPIGITLNFHSDDVLFEAITVFDVDYYKFSIGKLSIIKLLDWCFENNYRISDFSKGDFDYKHKWSNEVYDFYYHIVYDGQSLQSRLTAKALELFFKFKLFLRSYDFNVKYRKFLYAIGFHSKKVEAWQQYKVKKLDDFKIDEAYLKVDFNAKALSFLKQPIYTLLFAKPEPVDNIEVYKISNTESTFAMIGEKQQVLIQFE